MKFADRRHPWRVASRLWPLKANDEIITIVDLGSHKIACAIISITPSRFSGEREVKVLGSAIVRSSGLSGGRIANLMAVETSLRRAVAQAEAQAAVTAEDVAVTGQFPGLVGEIFEATLGTEQSFYRKEDVDAVTAAVED